MPFRRLVKKARRGACLFEMIAGQAMVREARKTLRMIPQAHEEQPVAVNFRGASRRLWLKRRA